MTAAEAERIKAALLVESSHLRREGPSTHSLTCDCQFLRALDAVIALQEPTEVPRLSNTKKKLEAALKRASDNVAKWPNLRDSK